MNKRPLIPSFLQRLDEKLLRNKPATWSARTHLVLWYALLFAAVLSGFCYLVFFDAIQYSYVGSWVNFVGVVAFLGFVFWVIFLLRFNVFKRFGNWFAWDGLKTFFLYFVSIGAMVAVCFIPSAVDTFRANRQFGNEEIVKDINELNQNICQLEYNLLPKDWKTDTTVLVDRKYDPMNNTVVVPNENAVVTDTVVEYTVKQNNYTYLDSAQLRRKINESDSLVKLADSMYVFYFCPEYQFVTVYSGDEYTKEKVKGPTALYYSVIKNYQKKQRAPLLKRMQELEKKYGVDSRYGSYDDNYQPGYNEPVDYRRMIISTYHLTKIENGLSNVVSKKYEWKEHNDVYFRFFYYTTLLLTMLVFIFRHTTIKVFFLTLLTAVILMIFTGMLMVISNGNISSIFSFMILYYIVFAGTALSIFRSGIRSTIQGIGLNLFLFMTPFVPLIFVSLREVIKYEDYDFSEKIEDAATRHLYYVSAEIIGSLILLILLEPVFKKLYRKWYAAPEN